MNSDKRWEVIKLVLILCWLGFTVAFAIWWFQLNIGYIHELARIQPEQAEHWQRQRRMVFWEGLSWIVLLVLGGGALIGLVQKEKRRLRTIQQFFASFSHEIKTSLASLRLQAETLKDENVDSPVLDRLVADTVRLQVQLENSLFLASQDDLQLYVQPLKLSQLLERMREQWPNLEIVSQTDATVMGDDRALRTIFSNLLQNAINHGAATRVEILVHPRGDRLQIDVKDNGQGFTGDTDQLGQLFYRPTAKSGSGLGLYICRLLSGRMGGDLQAHPSSSGFHVELNLPGSVP